MAYQSGFSMASARDRTERSVMNFHSMESFFSSLKTVRTASKTYRTCDEAKADVYDYIERFPYPRRRHSTLGYLSPISFEEQAALA